MSLDNRPSVVQNGPSADLGAIFETFSRFRRDHDYDNLVQYLITNYPKNVKNRTFNFNNAGHVFHMLYAYVPSPSNKERKQIRLDCIEKLIDSTQNDFKLYKDIINFMGEETSKTKCPCEVISARLNDNIVYNENLKNKNFDSKPSKLKKEPIDAILFKYSINWKTSLNKKKNIVNGVAAITKVKSKKILTANKDYNVISVDTATLVPSSLVDLNGFTVQSCKHIFVVKDVQLRAGDEAVSFVEYCKFCGCTNSK